MIKAGIVGASGYSGAELLRILAGHPEAEVSFATAGKHAGKAIAELHPNFIGFYDSKFVSYDPDLAESADVVFVGLPHGSSMKVVPELVSKGVRVVDLSGDFRFSDAAAYESWYGAVHEAPHLIGKAAYGLPEIYGEKIAKADFVSNPGCYPTGAALALAPFIKSGVVDPASIVIDSKSGASGAGRAPKDETLYGSIAENITAYKAGGKHQHIPEMEMVLSDLAGRDVVVSFTPHLAPMIRGILTTAYANLNSAMSTGELIELATEFYGGRPFIKVLPEGIMPQTKAVAGTNFCHIGIALDARAGRVVIASAIDNLVKGAAGQAIQNMNLMFGLDETAGLASAGLYP